MLAPSDAKPFRRNYRVTPVLTFMAGLSEAMFIIGSTTAPSGPTRWRGSLTASLIARKLRGGS
jgi:hypothetical protein